MKKKNSLDQSEKDRLRRNISLSLKKKLELLEEMREFTDRMTPAENKKIWQKLKKEGW